MVFTPLRNRREEARDDRNSKAEGLGREEQK